MKIQRVLWELAKKYRIFKNMRKKFILYTFTDRFFLSDDKIKLGEDDEKNLEVILLEHSKKFPQKYKEVSDKATNVIENSLVLKAFDENKIRLDMLFCFFSGGITPNEYVGYEFYNKNSKERKAFVSDRESLRLAYKLNDIDFIDIFMDKFKTYKKFKKFYKRDLISIKDDKDYDEFLSFANKHSCFVKKIANESCGRGVELIVLDNKSVDFKKMFDEFLNYGNVILEEKIEQHETLSKLNCSSVNTVRCFTLNMNGEVQVPYCFFRTGMNNAFVDNGGLGGIFIGIDIDKGCLCTNGFDELNNCYEIHPNSKIMFKGFLLPDFDKMLEICKEMAKEIPEIKWIGWDMAYTTNNEWVVVEGNSLSEVIGPQITSKKGIRDFYNRYMQ